MGELHTILGRILKAERERQNKSLADLAQELKIAEGHLLAIEAGDIGGVPSELYFKLFARSYSDALGIDYAKAIEAIREDMREREPVSAIGNDDRPVTRTTGQRTEAVEAKGKGGFIFLLAIGAVIIIAVVWLIFSKNDSLVLSGNEADSLATEAEEPRQDSDLVVGSSGRESMALSLDLVARDRTWAVVIADGDTALQTNLKPWREYYIGARDSLVVSIGSPLAVELMLNGTAANLTDPEHGTVSNVVITPENLAMYIQRALEDSARVIDTTKDSLLQDSTRPRQDTLHKTGTGSSPTSPAGKDTASTQRGTSNGL